MIMLKYLILAMLLFTLNAHALELSEKDLAGKWLIVKIGDLDTRADNDIWQFKNGKWTAISGGRALQPDSYKIVGDIIDLGYSKIKVLEFSKSVMKTKQMGFEYTLEKQ